MRLKNNLYTKMNEEIQQLNARIEKLEQMVNFFTRPDRYVFEKPVNGGTKGLKLEKTGGKIGFLGTDPVVQYATALNSAAGATYGSNEQNMLNAFRLGLTGYGLFHT